MNEFIDGLFTKFLPGWKVRLTAIAMFLLGPTVSEPGFLHQIGVDAPNWIYATMYALGMLGAGEKINALVKSNALMAAVEKSTASPRVLQEIEAAKPGSTVLPTSPDKA